MADLPSRRRFLRALAAPICAGAIGAPPARAETIRVSLADVGARPDAGDAEPALRAAFARLPARGGTLVVPPGEWRFARTEGVVLPVVRRNNIIIEGHGARLIFDGVAKPFDFTECGAPKIVGLTIDWKRAPFSQGEAIAVSADGRRADIRVDRAFPVDGSEPIAAFQTMEPGTSLMARQGLDVYGGVEKIEMPAAQTLRLSFARAVPLRAGDVVILRHRLYEANLMQFTRCRDLEVEDVTLRAGPGMGVFATGCDGGSIRRLTIAPPAASAASMTLTADGVHFSECRGRIVVDDCLMRGMGDDGVNVHGRYYVIAEIIDRRTLRVAAPVGSRFGARAASPEGDRFELAQRDYGSLGQVTATGSRDAREGVVLAFERDLPMSLQVGDLVRDVETDTRTRISGCKFPGNRARGVLAHADASIERCEFSGQSGPAVLLSLEPHFLEGPPVRSVELRGNSIADVSRGDPAAGAITINALSPGPKEDDAVAAPPVNRDVTIAGNSFLRCSSPAVIASSLSGALIANNKIQSTAKFAMSFDACANINVERNVFLANGIVEVSKNARNMKFVDNPGLVAPK